ncbi:MAG TPA: clostripain-related cysteine peptidase [candidate division Zixibacteria bacterium]|nr:clostripain-related cysteine peptidase [candidate division Zixibacteria bacterium]
MKKGLNHLAFLFIILILTAPIFSNSKQSKKIIEFEIKPQAVKNWTFILYFCADTRDSYVTQDLNNTFNGLGQAMFYTINDIYHNQLLDGSHTNLNVIALFDHPYSPDYPYGQCKLYELRKNNIITLTNYGARNMGSAATLQNFIDFCKTNYPANNYALLMSDHGRGYAGLCYDYHAPHPYVEYALGDCLELEEFDNALTLAGGVDVIFLDTCMGGSFELMWQIEGNAHYVVAGETIQRGSALYHPIDILWNLSRNTGIDSSMLADIGFSGAANPIIAPDDPYGGRPVWPTVAIYDLTELHKLPHTGGDSLSGVFTDFVDTLFLELYENITRGRELFREIRSKLFYPFNLISSKCMMVDLGDFVSAILDNTHKMAFGAIIETYGIQLLYRLSEGSGKLIHKQFINEQFLDENITGLTICFPDTLDMYTGFLYPYLYEDFDISKDTDWNDFIFGTYPQNYIIFDHYKYLEFYEIQIGPIDPTIHMHVFFEEDPFEKPLHIGHSNPMRFPGMGIEVGIEGAEFIDDMLFGMTNIRIPVMSIQALRKGSSSSFSVVVNASTAASAVQDINLTIRHVLDEEIVWEENKIEDIQVGQVLSLEVSTDDTMSDFEELVPPLNDTRKTGFFGIEKPVMIFTVTFVFIIPVMIVRRKRRK